MNKTNLDLLKLIKQQDIQNQRELAELSGYSLGLVNREVKYFAGRQLGVELSGTQRQRVVQVSAALLDSSARERQALEDLAYMPVPFMYRDPLGRVLYGSLSDVQLGREVGGVWSVSAKLTEVNRG